MREQEKKTTFSQQLLVQKQIAKQEVTRRVHMTQEQLQEKIQHLEARIAEVQGPENKTKRKRFYHELAQLKKHIILVDPNEIEEKRKRDLDRRVQKKIQKKQQIVEEAQREKKQIKMKEKNKTCLVCKKIGHTAQHCREVLIVTNQNTTTTSQVICYNCGSKQHTLKDCQKPKSNTLKFASCFVCKETGHISRDCPKNPKGLYAYGGGCYICGNTHHTQANCPQHPRNRIQQQQEQQNDYLSD